MRILLLICLFALQSIASGQVSTLEDEFTGEVTIQSDGPRFISTQEDDLSRAMAAVIYQSPYYALGIYAYSGSEMVFDYSTKTAYFLIDKERLQVPVEDVDSKYESNNVISTVALIMSREDFKTISESITARVKINDYVFTITDNVKSDMKEVLKRVDNEQ